MEHFQIPKGVTVTVIKSSVVLPSICRVGSHQYGGVCVERRHDACLVDGDCLLFHDLVDGGAVLSSTLIMS